MRDINIQIALSQTGLKDVPSQASQFTLQYYVAKLDIKNRHTQVIPRNPSLLKFLQAFHISPFLKSFGHLFLRNTQSLHDVVLPIERSIQRRVTFDRLSIAVDDELGEVPFDKVAQSTALLVFQVLPQWMSLVAVDFDLRIHIERRVIIVRYELFDLWFRPRLLATELIAGETSYAQTIRLVLLI